MKLSYIDDHGIKEYALWLKILVAFTVLYTYIGLMAYPLFIAENASGNIHSYWDAFWLLQMSASTIGFGDFYPNSSIGRWIVVFTFYVGVGLAGYIGSSIASYFTSFTDNSIQNRELRAQNAEIISLLKKQNK